MLNARTTVSSIIHIVWSFKTFVRITLIAQPVMHSITALPRSCIQALFTTGIVIAFSRWRDWAVGTAANIVLKQFNCTPCTQFAHSNTSLTNWFQCEPTQYTTSEILQFEIRDAFSCIPRQLVLDITHVVLALQRDKRMVLLVWKSVIATRK